MIAVLIDALQRLEVCFFVFQRQREEVGGHLEVREDIILCESEVRKNKETCVFESTIDCLYDTLLFVSGLLMNDCSFVFEKRAEVNMGNVCW